MFASRSIMVFLCFLLCIQKSLVAQEEIGYSTSNYSGIQGLFLNPAKGCDSRMFVDVNLLGLDVFVHNNYVYLARDQFYLWKNIQTGFPSLSINNREGYKRAQIILNVTGPSAHLSVGKHSIGLITRARSYTSAKIDLPLATHIVEGFKYGPQLARRYDLENMYANSLTWFEYGLSYGYIFQQSKYTMMSAGLNLRYLNGLNAIGIEVDKFDYEVRDDSLMEFYNFSGQIKQAIPALGAGKGVGIDLGFEYKHMKADASRYFPNSPRSGCKKIDYKWKAGASILDIGFIRFNRLASKQDFENISSSWYKYDSTGVTNYGGADSLIDSRFNAQGSITKLPAFNAWLPAAVSAQFDYNFENNLYVNATATFGPRLGNNVRRGSLLAIVPRYERKRFELSLPLSLWNYRYPQIGAQLRLNNMFIIGSDRIMPFVFRSNVYGLDIYFHLKFSLYRNPACNKGKGKAAKGKSKTRRKGGIRTTDCPAYS